MLMKTIMDFRFWIVSMNFQILTCSMQKYPLLFKKKAEWKEMVLSK